MPRKFLFLLLIFSAGALTANCQTAAVKTKECKYLSLTEAEKILGRRVEQVTNSWTFTREATTFDCTYRGVEKDPASGKEINLFFKLVFYNFRVCIFFYVFSRQ